MTTGSQVKSISTNGIFHLSPIPECHAWHPHPSPKIAESNKKSWPYLNDQLKKSKKGVFVTTAAL
jgi:hypothetical protein